MTYTNPSIHRGRRLRTGLAVVLALVLAAGVYLLTSDDCNTCVRARNELVRRGVPHTELSWQKNPDVFESLNIDAVPSVIEVGGDGSATWWRGGVPRRLPRSG